MKNQKKRNWLKTTLCVLVACGILGTIIGGIIFLAKPGKTGVSASVLFSFNGSANGIAPNGYAFDAKGITSDGVLEKALEDAGLADKYTAQQVQEALEVRGIYPKDIVSQLTSFDSKLDFNANRTLTVSSYFPTQYAVTLNNDFDKSISRQDLEKLLNCILAAYRAHFAETCAVGANEIAIGRYSADDDYTQQLTVLTQDLQASADYAAELNNRYPSMKLNGKGFGDIATQLQALIKNDAKELSASVAMNRMTKNPSGMSSLYRYKINSLTTEMTQDQALLAELDVLIGSYERNGDIYLATSGALTKIDSNTYDTYDTLIEKRKTTADRITEINVEIEDYRTRLRDIEGPDTETTTEDNEEQPAAPAPVSANLADEADLQAEIDALVKKRETVMTEFAALIKAYNEQEINDSTVTFSAVKYSAPSLLSAAFLKQALKTAGPFMALGFMVCLVLLIISRRKEEKLVKRDGSKPLKKEG